MKNEFLFKLGYRFAQIRIKKDISQEKLEELSGISKNTITNFETGKTNTGVDTLHKMAQPLDIDIAQLFSDAEHTPVMYSPIIERIVEQLNHEDEKTLKFIEEQIQSLLKFKKNK